MPTILYLLASSPALNKPGHLPILIKFIPFNFNFHFTFPQDVRRAGIRIKLQIFQQLPNAGVSLVKIFHCLIIKVEVIAGRILIDDA